MNLPIPTVSLSPSGIVFYRSWEKTSRNRFKFSNLTPAPYSKPNFSNNARKRMTKAIRILCLVSKWKSVWSIERKAYFRFKLSFITLTLPCQQRHDDRFLITNLLSPFLNSWKKANPNLLYVWKAEVQDNGNLHFHLTTNVFIHHQKLRDRWNKACCKIGYFNRTAENPNSTDVHSVRDMTNIEAYLIAYLSKKDLYMKPLKRYFKRYGKQIKQSRDDVFMLPRNYFKMIKRSVECRLWSSSKELGCKNITYEIGEDEFRICENALSFAPDDVLLSDYFTLLPYKSLPPSVIELYQVGYSNLIKNDSNIVNIV